MKKALDHLEAILQSKEYQRFREDDSPKGETVPGVRHQCQTESVSGVKYVRLMTVEYSRVSKLRPSGRGYKEAFRNSLDGCRGKTTLLVYFYTYVC